MPTKSGINCQRLKKYVSIDRTMSVLWSCGFMTFLNGILFALCLQGAIEFFQKQNLLLFQICMQIFFYEYGNRLKSSVSQKKAHFLFFKGQHALK